MTNLSCAVGPGVVVFDAQRHDRPPGSGRARAHGAETVWLSSLDLSKMEQSWGKSQIDRSISETPLSLAVGLFNRNEMAATVTAKWSDLGIQGKQRARDLWRQKDIGTLEGQFSASLPGQALY